MSQKMNLRYFKFTETSHKKKRLLFYIGTAALIAVTFSNTYLWNWWADTYI